MMGVVMKQVLIRGHESAIGRLVIVRTEEHIEIGMGGDDAAEPIECVASRYGIGVDEEQIPSSGELREMVSRGGGPLWRLPDQMEEDADVCQLIDRNGWRTPIVTDQDFTVGQTMGAESGEALPEVFHIVANRDANRKQHHRSPSEVSGTGYLAALLRTAIVL